MHSLGPHILGLNHSTLNSDTWAIRYGLHRQGTKNNVLGIYELFFGPNSSPARKPQQCTNFCLIGWVHPPDCADFFFSHLICTALPRPQQLTRFPVFVAVIQASTLSNKRCLDCLCHHLVLESAGGRWRLVYKITDETRVLVKELAAAGAEIKKHVARFPKTHAKRNEESPDRKTEVVNPKSCDFFPLFVCLFVTCISNAREAPCMPLGVILPEL